MSDDSLISKAKMIGVFINQVGVPVFLVIVFTGIVLATYMGYIANPLVTQDAFLAHSENTQQLHGTLIGIGKQEVQVLKEMKIEFQAMRCERKQKVEDQRDCLSLLSRQSQTD